MLSRQTRPRPIRARLSPRLAAILPAALAPAALGQFTNLARLPSSAVSASTPADQHSAPVPLDPSTQISTQAHNSGTCTAPVRGAGNASAGVNSSLSPAAITSSCNATASATITQPCNLGGWGMASASDRVTFSVAATTFLQYSGGFSRNDGANGSSTPSAHLFGDNGIDWRFQSSPGSGSGGWTTCVFLRPGNYELDTGASTSQATGTSSGSGGATMTARLAPFTPAVQPASLSACSTGSGLFWIDGIGPILTVNWQVQTSPGEWLTLTQTPQDLPCGGTAALQYITIPSEVFITIHACPGITDYQVRVELSDGTNTFDTAASTYSVCYANCDCSGVAPVLNVNDFVCFMNKFADGDAYANCDGSTAAPVLNVNDFICFQQKFAAGCP